MVVNCSRKKMRFKNERRNEILKNKFREGHKYSGVAKDLSKPMKK